MVKRESAVLIFTTCILSSRVFAYCRVESLVVRPSTLILIAKLWSRSFGHKTACLITCCPVVLLFGSLSYYLLHNYIVVKSSWSYRQSTLIFIAKLSSRVFDHKTVCFDIFCRIFFGGPKINLEIY